MGKAEADSSAQCAGVHPVRNNATHWAINVPSLHAHTPITGPRLSGGTLCTLDVRSPWSHGRGAERNKSGTAPTLWQRSQPRPDTAALSRPTSSGSTGPTGSCRRPSAHGRRHQLAAGGRARPRSRRARHRASSGLGWGRSYCGTPINEPCRTPEKAATTAERARRRSISGQAPPTRSSAAADCSATCFHFFVVF